MNTLPSGWVTPEAKALLQEFSTEQYRAGILGAYLSQLNDRRGHYVTWAAEKAAPHRVEGLARTAEMIASAMRTELPLVPCYVGGTEAPRLLGLIRVDDETGVMLLGSGASVATGKHDEPGLLDDIELEKPFTPDQFNVLVDQVVAMDELGLKCIKPFGGFI